ncbi:hypothetical protein FJ365_04380 [Candidatus Dependentiae bacterium]|nr:hypothetical protein [Candidatus Dependentiae bacterium]
MNQKIDAICFPFAHPELVEGRPVRGGRAKLAFTLVEMLAVIFLASLLLSMILPLLNRRQKPEESWETLHEQLNQIASFARQEALIKRKVYRLVFEQVPNREGKVFVEQEQPDPEHAEKKMYIATKSDYQLTSLTLTHGRTIRAVYIGRQNVLGDQEKQACCYVIPDGMMQPVVLQIAKKDKFGEEVVSFQLNPFLGSFDRHEGKFKPE